MKKAAGIALIIFGVILFMSSLQSFFSYSTSAEKKIAKNISSTTKIELESTSFDWEIQPYEGEELIVELNETHKQSQLLTSEKNGMVKVEAKGRGFRMFSFWRESPHATVYIPKNYDKAISCKTVSGDIEIFGDFKLSDAQVKTVSGDVEVEQVRVGQLTAASTSGDLEVKELAGNIDGKTVSGDIELIVAKSNEAVSLKTTSGDVQIDIPEGNANLSLKTTSGDLVVNHSLKQQDIQKRKISGKIGNGEHPVSISTTSGDIIVN